MPKEVIYRNHEQVDNDHEPPLPIVIWHDNFVQVGVQRQIDSHEDGMFATVGRHQINNLIRQLRRARDRAYGADL